MSRCHKRLKVEITQAKDKGWDNSGTEEKKMGDHFLILVFSWNYLLQVWTKPSALDKGDSELMQLWR